MFYFEVFRESSDAFFSNVTTGLVKRRLARRDANPGDPSPWRGMGARGIENSKPRGTGDFFANPPGIFWGLFTGMMCGSK